MIKFTLKEEIGVNRKHWGVSGGIPLPKGLIKPDDEILIINSRHGVINADVTVLSR